MEILILILLILLNGVFSMSEIALVSSRKSRLEAEVKQGNARAKAALELAESPNRFLSTVQVGITLIGILTGIYSGQSLTVPIQSFLEGFESLRPYAHTISVGLVVVVITYLSVVVGELLPKQIGLTNPEGITKTMAGPMNLLSRLVSPFIWLLSASSSFLIKIMNIRPSDDNLVTEDEIKALMEEGASEGTIQEIEHDIVKNVFHLGDRRIGSLMTHRQDIVWLDVADDLPTNKEKILHHKQTLYPLCRGSIDEVLGMLYSIDLLGMNLDEQLLRLEELKQEALFIPENSKAYYVLEKFKECRIHNAIIVDEYGGVMGMVTINDIFDALVGDIAQDSQSEYEITPRADGSYLIDAQIPFEEFLDYFSVPYPNRKEFAGFHTLGGFALNILNGLPNTGDVFQWSEYVFEIVDMDKSRIDKILFRKPGADSSKISITSATP